MLFSLCFVPKASACPYRAPFPFVLFSFQNAYSRPLKNKKRSIYLIFRSKQSTAIACWGSRPFHSDGQGSVGNAAEIQYWKPSGPPMREIGACAYGLQRCSWETKRSYCLLEENGSNFLIFDSCPKCIDQKRHFKIILPVLKNVGKSRPSSTNLILISPSSLF